MIAKKLKLTGKKLNKCLDESSLFQIFKSFEKTKLIASLQQKETLSFALPKPIRKEMKILNPKLLYQYPNESCVKVATQFGSIEAYGQNARNLTYAYVFMLICLGMEALSNVFFKDLLEIFIGWLK